MTAFKCRLWVVVFFSFFHHITAYEAPTRVCTIGFRDIRELSHVRNMSNGCRTGEALKKQQTCTKCMQRGKEWEMQSKAKVFGRLRFTWMFGGCRTGVQNSCVGGIEHKMVQILLQVTVLLKVCLHVFVQRVLQESLGSDRCQIDVRTVWHQMSLIRRVHSSFILCTQVA